jgi:hypothetical protein
MYLRCEDYEWLKEGIETTTLFTPAQKTEIILKWIEHTDPHCFGGTQKPTEGTGFNHLISLGETQ